MMDRGINKESRTKRRLKAVIGMLFNYPSRLFSGISLSAIVVDSGVEKTSALDSGVRFYRSSLGRYSYIGRDSFVESARIGSFCSISGNCSIGGGSHPISRISSSPVFCAGGNILKENLAQGEFDPFSITEIGNDVWIGNGVMIKSGITISNGAIIGMGSVVTKDVGPYEIWAGNPARFIRKRFDDETIAAIEHSEWWLWDEQTIKSRAQLFEIEAIDAIEQGF